MHCGNGLVYSFFQWPHDTIATTDRFAPRAPGTYNFLSSLPLLPHPLQLGADVFLKQKGKGQEVLSVPGWIFDLAFLTDRYHRAFGPIESKAAEKGKVLGQYVFWTESIWSTTNISVKPVGESNFSNISWGITLNLKRMGIYNSVLKDISKHWTNCTWNFRPDSLIASSMERK